MKVKEKNVLLLDKSEFYLTKKNNNQIFKYKVHFIQKISKNLQEKNLRFEKIIVK